MSGVYIISAPSGSGKSTLVNRVRADCARPEIFHLLHHPGARGQASRTAANIFSSRGLNSRK